MLQPDHAAFLLTTTAVETCDWLRLNEASINAEGVEVKKPWFDEIAYATPPANFMMRKAREDTVASQAYEHGIAKCLEIANSKGLIKIARDDIHPLVFARSGEVQGWLNVLTRYSWIGRPMNLRHFRDTGDFHPETPQAHAKKKLERLENLNFVTVTRPANEFIITVGPLAKTFYENIWFPIKEEFTKKIAECEGDKS